MLSFSLTLKLFRNLNNPLDLNSNTFESFVFDCIFSVCIDFSFSDWQFVKFLILANCWNSVSNTSYCLGFQSVISFWLITYTSCLVWFCFCFWLALESEWSKLVYCLVAICLHSSKIRLLWDESWSRFKSAWQGGITLKENEERGVFFSVFVYFVC